MICFWETGKIVDNDINTILVSWTNRKIFNPSKSLIDIHDQWTFYGYPRNEQIRGIISKAAGRCAQPERADRRTSEHSRLPPPKICRSNLAQRILNPNYAQHVAKTPIAFSDLAKIIMEIIFNNCFKRLA